MTEAPLAVTRGWALRSPDGRLFVRRTYLSKVDASFDNGALIKEGFTVVLVEIREVEETS